MNDMVMIRRDLCERVFEAAGALTNAIVVPDTPAAREIDQVKLAKALLRLADRRSMSVRPALLGEPGWYILLELYVAHAEQRRVPVSSLCVASLSPGTTALRAIENMHLAGEITRSPDPVDGRRIYVSLTDAGYTAIDEALSRRRWE